MTWLVAIIAFIIGLIIGWWFTRGSYESQLETANEAAARARREASTAKEAADQATTDAEKARADADAANTRADQATKDAEAANTRADQATADADKARADAEAANTRADQATKDAEAANTRADQATADADKARADGRAARANADELRGEIAAVRAEANEAEIQAAAVPFAATQEAPPTAAQAPIAADEGEEQAPTEELDDLTRVEGIGPKIAELLNDGGIRTFSELAEAAVESLQRILEEAGSRYRMHDPSSWPDQAGLAAAGRWDDLQELQDRLSGGRTE